MENGVVLPQKSLLFLFCIYSYLNISSANGARGKTMDNIDHGIYLRVLFFCMYCRKKKKDIVFVHGAAIVRCDCRYGELRDEDKLQTTSGGKIHR